MIIALEGSVVLRHGNEEPVALAPGSTGRIPASIVRTTVAFAKPKTRALIAAV